MGTHLDGNGRPPALRLLDEPRIDRRRAERAATEMLDALGVDPLSEGTRETPRRLVDVYAELLTPQAFSPTTFPNDGGYDELVVARSIQFHSLCEHHLLPFVGVVLEAEHMCMSLRGVQKAGASTVTSSLHGLIRDDPRTRQEFLALTARS